MSNLLEKLNLLPVATQPSVRKIISLATTGTIEEARRQVRRIIGQIGGDKSAYVNRVSDMTSDERDAELDTLLSDGEALATVNANKITTQRRLAEDILDNLAVLLLSSAVDAGLTAGA